MRSSPRLLGNVLVAAAALRILGLDDHSLWLDEGATWDRATRPTVAETALSDANHPPGWWLATRAALALGARGEAGLRFPAAVLGIVAVLLAWLLARRLLDPARVPARGGFRGLDARAAAWVAVLAAANPLWVETSQEARMYAALLAESLGLSLLYLRWLDRGGRRTLVAYAALALLSLLTHYFAVWTVAGHALHALWASRATRTGGSPVRAGPFLVAVAAAGLGFAPWFLHAREGMRSFEAPWLEGPGHAAHALWRMGVGPALVVLDRARVEGGLARTLAEEAPMVAATAVLWFVPIALGVVALRRDRGLLALVVACVAMPVLALLALHARYPLLQDRYLVGLSPFLLVLAALGAGSARGALRPVLLGGLVLLCAGALLAYHLPQSPPGRWLSQGHPYGKEQWRDARAWVSERLGKDDPVLLHPGPRYLEMPWDFYDRGAHPKVLLPIEALDAAEVLRRHPVLSTARGAVLLLSHEETPDPDHYADVVREAWLRASVERGEDASFEGPVVFPLQWGIRAFLFRRAPPGDGETGR